MLAASRRRRRPRCGRPPPAAGGPGRAGRRCRSSGSGTVPCRVRPSAGDGDKRRGGPRCRRSGSPAFSEPPRPRQGAARRRTVFRTRTPPHGGRPMPPPDRMLNTLRRAIDFVGPPPAGPATWSGSELHRGPRRRRPARPRPELPGRPQGRRPGRPPDPAPGPARGHPRQVPLPDRRGQVAPTGGPVRGPEVPVPGPGASPARQPRAGPVDRPPGRQGGRDAQRPVPPGGDEAYGPAAGRTSTGRTATCSRRCRWPCGRRTACSSATACPPAGTWRRSTRSGWRTSAYEDREFVPGGLGVRPALGPGHVGGDGRGVPAEGGRRPAGERPHPDRRRVHRAEPAAGDRGLFADTRRRTSCSRPTGRSPTPNW